MSIFTRKNPTMPPVSEIDDPPIELPPNSYQFKVWQIPDGHWGMAVMYRWWYAQIDSITEVNGRAIAYERKPHRENDEIARTEIYSDEAEARAAAAGVITRHREKKGGAVNEQWAQWEDAEE